MQDRWSFRKEMLLGILFVTRSVKLQQQRICPVQKSLSRQRLNSANLLTLMQEFVIQDAGREPRIFRLFLFVLGSSNASLTEHSAVFLSRNLFGHLEDHLHQRVVGKALRAPQEHTGLAEVLDNAFMPAPKVLHPVT